MISAFIKLLFACAQTSPADMDIVGELPVEVSSTVLRYLDSESLVNAASVNRRWKSICKNDVVLRKRIHKRLRQERKARIEAYMKPSKAVRIVREEGVPAPIVQFGMRNNNVSIQKLPVKYEAPKPMKNLTTTMFKVSIKSDGKLRSLPKLKKNKISNATQKSRNIRL